MKLLKMILSLATLLVLLLAAAGAGWLASLMFANRLAADRIHVGLTVERLSEVSELLTLRIDLCDVLVSRLDGFTGGAQAAVLIRGDVSIGIDLYQSRFEDIDNNHRTARLILPAPTPSGARIDHEKTRIIDLSEHGLWLLVPTSRAYEEVANKAMIEAQQLLVAATIARDADERARTHAAVVLTTFCRSLGWEITIQWADQTPRAK